MKSEGKPGDGSPKPDGSRAEGQYWAPKNVEWWSLDKPAEETLKVKADSFYALEGSRPECDLASIEVTTGV